MASPPKKRSAGILMHITSLPSPFGIGDMGPEAFKFADFLNRSNQHFWQILPLTPIEKGQSYSPYSAVSSMAGNILLISPDQLKRDGLLEDKDLKQFRMLPAGNVDYDLAVKIKESLLERAYMGFQKRKQNAFDNFCDQQAFWLDDFALYMVLRNHFNDTPWYQWPKEFKLRQRKNLLQFAEANSNEIRKAKWLQFIFFRQWKDLKKYCNGLDIKILGDLPFYVSYDSVDVWAHPEIFEIKKDGSIASVAGVPPDYFNKDGQLWGMPVYRWDELKSQRYVWWIDRIRKNMELVDLLRLDHFRAFADYWAVPAGNKTAVKGKWKPGPGEAFFKVVEKEFGELPFVAEDLGDISPDVYILRDKFKLPGMKVLQFAFGDTMPESDHIPHNYSQQFVAYTGTHDNNTTRGWYQSEVKAKIRKQIEDYAGCAVTEENVSMVMTKIAYASVADIVIIPLQDILGLDKTARMNIPASTQGNWAWQLTSQRSLKEQENTLKLWTTIYNRT